MTSALRPELAVGYKRQFDDRPWRSGGSVFPATWLETSSGAGSIVMDVSDMLGYAEFLLRTWDGVDSPVLTSAQLRAMVDSSPVCLNQQRKRNMATDSIGERTMTRTLPDEIVFLGHGAIWSDTSPICWSISPTASAS